MGTIPIDSDIEPPIAKWLSRDLGLTPQIHDLKYMYRRIQYENRVDCQSSGIAKVRMAVPYPHLILAQRLLENIKRIDKCLF